MLMRRFQPACLFAVLACPFSMHAADADFQVKVEKADPPAELKDAVKGLLGDEALRVQDGKGSVVCTIWFRKEVPSKATAEQVKNGLTYREIAQTTLIGAIELPQNWIDFRKQEIPKGTYTLRLAIQPMDGDHMGTAPHTEFCLLCSADKDEKPDTMEVKALRELSAASHGATHPAVLFLFPNAKPEDQPKIVGKGNGIYVLNVKQPVGAGSQKATLGFGMTIAGHTSE
jgi:hypothetical protein